MSNLIEEADVTAVTLSLQLEKTFIQHRLQDDESIYVTEDCFYPFWIKVLNNRGFIGLSTHTLFRTKTTKFQRLEFCNRINYQYFLLTAYMTNDDKLKFDHVLSYRDGILEATFIRGCREFSRTIEIAIRDLDPENEIILPPGHTESEDAENNGSL